MEPVAVGEMVPVRVIVKLPPETRFNPLHNPVLTLKLPEEGVPKVAPSKLAGITSVRVKFTMVLGPLLATMMV